MVPELKIPVASARSFFGNHSATALIDAALREAPGPVYLDPPSLDLWPDVQWQPDYNKSRKVDLNTLTRAEVERLRPLCCAS